MAACANDADDAVQMIEQMRALLAKRSGNAQG